MEAGRRGVYRKRHPGRLMVRHSGRRVVGLRARADECPRNLIAVDVGDTSIIHVQVQHNLLGQVAAVRRVGNLEGVAEIDRAIVVLHVVQHRVVVAVRVPNRRLRAGDPRHVVGPFVVVRLHPGPARSVRQRIVAEPLAILPAEVRRTQEGHRGDLRVGPAGRKRGPPGTA